MKTKSLIFSIAVFFLGFAIYVSKLEAIFIKDTCCLIARVAPFVGLIPIFFWITKYIEVDEK